MNYLAHAFLSFGYPEILVGNLISDFVKGKKKYDYPVGIQQGIALHRAIDEFTDQHSATRRAKLIFREHYGLYSAAFIDVVYDYFLANDMSIYSEATLLEFSQWVYSTLSPYQALFPEKFKLLFPYMVRQNWLFNYRSPEGIRSSFGGLVRRARYMQESETAYGLFQKHHDYLNSCYSDFFPGLRAYASSTLQNILKEGSKMADGSD